MVDQDLVDYIKKYRTQFDTDALRKGLLQQGVEYKDIKEAFDFIDQEKKEKIAEIIKGDGPFDEEEERVARKRNIMEEVRGMVGDVSHKIGEGNYKERITGAWDSVSVSLGVKHNDKALYLDAIRYGALSFLFMDIIASVFRYMGGTIIVPQLMLRYKDLWYLNFPDIFVSKIFTFDFFLSVVWSMIIGGVISFAFMKYLTGSWPFSIWRRLQKKTFALLVIFELVFGFIFGITLSDISFRHMLGYIVVLVGIAVSSYLSAVFFSSNMERKHEDGLREIIK